MGGGSTPDNIVCGDRMPVGVKKATGLRGRPAGQARACGREIHLRGLKQLRCEEDRQNLLP